MDGLVGEQFVCGPVGQPIDARAQSLGRPDHIRDVLGGRVDPDRLRAGRGGQDEKGGKNEMSHTFCIKVRDHRTASARHWASPVDLKASTVGRVSTRCQI